MSLRDMSFNRASNPGLRLERLATYYPVWSAGGLVYEKAIPRSRTSFLSASALKSYRLLLPEERHRADCLVSRLEPNLLKRHCYQQYSASFLKEVASWQPC